jgi:OOP family OmpA-OmpF porin
MAWTVSPLVRLIVAGLAIGALSSPARACTLVAPAIAFSRGSATIDAAALPVLDQFVNQFLRSRVSPARIVLAGHADLSGPRVFNLQLSRRRAEAVRDWLLLRGVPASLLAVGAYGSQEDEADAIGDNPAHHRRVDIIWEHSPAGLAELQAERDRLTAAGIPIPVC